MAKKVLVVIPRIGIEVGKKVKSVGKKKALIEMIVDRDAYVISH